MAYRILKYFDYYVYVLFRRDTGEPFYVGYGRGDRWSDHEKEARGTKRMKHANWHKINVIRQMQIAGLDIPKVKIRENLSLPEAHEIEITLIAAIGRHPDGPLVNRTNGGDGTEGWRHTPESLAKMSAAQRARPPRPPYSEETRRKMSLAGKGRPKSAEHRRKIGAGNLGKPKPSISAKLKGIKRSPETREKMRIIALNRPPISEETRAKLSAAQKGRTWPLRPTPLTLAISQAAEAILKDEAPLPLRALRERLPEQIQGMLHGHNPLNHLSSVLCHCRAPAFESLGKLGWRLRR